jgi:hypothetical protein
MELLIDFIVSKRDAPSRGFRNLADMCGIGVASPAEERSYQLETNQHRVLLKDGLYGRPCWPTFSSIV